MQRHSEENSIQEYDSISLGNEHLDITLKVKFTLDRYKKALVRKILKNVIEKISNIESEEESYVKADEVIKEILVDIPSSEKIGSKIRIARVNKDMTQADLCQKAKLTQPQLSAIENNKHIPSMETLKKISGALKTRIDTFI